MPVYVSDLSELQSAVAAPPSDGLIYLTADIALSSANGLIVGHAVTIQSDPASGQVFSLTLPADASYNETYPNYTYVFKNSATLTLLDIILNGNNVPYIGGISGGTLIINDGAVITDFVSSGSVYVTNVGWTESYVIANSQVTMNGGTITGNNISGSTGALITYSTVTLNDGSITGNTMSGNEAALITEGKLTINGGTITQNTGNSISDALIIECTIVMNGGSIAYNTSPYAIISTYGGSFTMNDGEISHNTITSRNGQSAVHNDRSWFIMNGGTISYNTSLQWGGGVSNRGAFTMNGGTISHNQTAGGGGGIFNWQEQYCLINGGSIVYNVAAENGGGISGDIYGGSDHTLQVICGDISNNTALNGGGIYSSLDTLGNSGGCNCQEGDFCAPAFQPDCSLQTGSDCASCQLAPSYCLTITNNTAQQNGGGIYLEPKSRTESTDEIIDYDEDGNPIYGIVNIPVPLISNCALIANNTATNGGGMYVSSINGADLEQVAIACNKAANNGGGIYFQAFSSALAGFVIKNSSVLGNTAGVLGGGMYISPTIFSTASDVDPITIAPDTCFGNNSAPMSIASGLVIPSIQYCSKSLEGNTLFNNYDISPPKNTKVPAPDTVSYGNQLRWTVTFITASTLYSPSFQDNLAPFTLVPGSASATVNNNAVSVNVSGTGENPYIYLSGTLAAGSIVTLTFLVNVPKVFTDTVFTNTITFGNSLTATGQVTVLGASELSPTDTFTKMASPTAGVLGDTFTYTVTFARSELP